MNRTRRWTVWTAAVVFTGVLAFAPSASATVIEGTGLVVGKDMQSRQLTLMSGLVLQVIDTTKFISKAGVRITLAQIDVAPSKDGVVRALPDAMIRFQARKQRDGVSALTVRVIGTIPQ